MTRIFRKNLIGAAAMVAWGVTASQAAMIPETATIAPEPVGLGNQLTFNIPQFNGSLGTLTSVQLTFTPTFGNFGYDVYNLASTPEPVANETVSMVTGTLTSSLGTVSYSTGTQSLNSGPFTANAGPGSMTEGNLPFVFQTTPLMTTVGPSGYVGSGVSSLVFTESDPGSVSGTPGSGVPGDTLFFGWFGNIGGVVDADYYYTPVPEPSTVFAAFGMLGLSVWRKRK